MAQTRRYLSHSLVALGMTAVLTSMAACGQADEASGGKPSSSPSTSAPQSPSAAPTGTEDSEKKVVLERYRESWEAQVKAHAQADSKATDLHKTTSLNALAQIESELMSMKKAGAVTVGEPKINPRVTSIKRQSGAPDVAKISDCVDISKWVLVEKESGEEIPLPSERLTKYVMHAELRKWGKSWMLVELEALEQRC